MALEDPEFTRKRVKLFKTGKFSQDEITQIFETLNSPNDLNNLPRIVDKAIQILNESLEGNGTSFLMLKELVKVMIENERSINDITKITIEAKKKKGKWHYTVGVL